MIIRFILYLIVFVASFIKSDDELPAWNKYEFKIKIEPGRYDCFYQTAIQGSMLHVSFQLLKGNDIHFHIKDPHGIIIMQTINENTGSHQVQKVPFDGDYEICMINDYTHMYEKVVYLYILSFHTEVMQAKFEEEQTFNETATLIKKSTNKINLQMLEVYTQQSLERFRQARDEYLLEANMNMVQHWSIAQSIIIVLSGLFQAYFIKRLFRVKDILKK